MARRDAIERDLVRLQAEHADAMLDLCEALAEAHRLPPFRFLDDDRQDDLLSDATAMCEPIDIDPEGWREAAPQPPTFARMIERQFAIAAEIMRTERALVAEMTAP